MLRVAALVAVLAASWPGLAAAQGPGPTCRTIRVATDGVTQDELICQAADGTWHYAREGARPTPAPAVVVPVRPLPAKPFRGSISYSGTYAARFSRPAPPPRISGDLNRTLNNVMRAAAQAQTQTREAAGAITVDLMFEPTGAVAGSYSATGLGRGTLSGTKTGGMCRLFERDGRPWTGQCDEQGFFGEAGSTPGARIQSSIRFTAPMARTVDLNAADSVAATAPRPGPELVRPSLARPAPTVATAPAAAPKPATGPLPPARLAPLVAAHAKTASKEEREEAFEYAGLLRRCLAGEEKACGGYAFGAHYELEENLWMVADPAALPPMTRLCAANRDFGRTSYCGAEVNIRAVLARGGRAPTPEPPNPYLKCVEESRTSYNVRVDIFSGEETDDIDNSKATSRERISLENVCSYAIAYDLRDSWNSGPRRLDPGKTTMLPKGAEWANPRRAK